MNRPLVVLLLAVMTGFAGAAFPQQRYGVSVDVTVVEVPVTVTDRAGNPVRGLGKEDFKLFVDGVRTPVQYFDTVDLAEGSSGSGDKPLPAAAFRNFLLLFDLANSSPSSLVRARDAAREFLSSQMTDRDVAAVATYRSDDGVRLLTNFTRDRKLLEESVAAIGSDADFAAVDPLLLKVVPHGTATQLAILNPDVHAGPPPAKVAIEAAEDEKRKDLNRSAEMAEARERLRRVHTQLDNLAALALALDRLNGQKQVILLSEGFPAQLLTGREKLGFSATQEENDAVSSGETWKVDSEKRFGSVSGTSAVERMAEVFRRADVRLHAIDIRGVRANTDASQMLKDAPEGMSVSGEGLSLVARPTGGTVFRNTNDMVENFRRMLRRQEVVYILGFKSGGATAGAYRRIRVETTTRNANVDYRRGYFESTPYANDLERVVGVGEVLTKDVERSEVPVALRATPISPSRVLVAFEIDGASVLDEAPGERTAVDVFVYAFDDQRNAHDFLQQRIVLDVARTHEAVMRGGLRYVGTLDVAPGAWSINAVARVAGSRKLGSAHVALTIPGSSDAMSPALLPLALPEDGVTVISPARASAVTHVPRVRTAIAAGAEQEFALLVSGTADGKLGASLRTASGERIPAAVRLVQSSDDGFLLALSAAGVGPGVYDFEVTVSSAARGALTASVPVTIR